MPVKFDEYETTDETEGSGSEGPVGGVAQHTEKGAASIALLELADQRLEEIDDQLEQAVKPLGDAPDRGASDPR